MHSCRLRKEILLCYHSIVIRYQYSPLAAFFFSCVLA